MTSLPVELLVALGAVFVSVALLTGLAGYAVLSRPSLTQRRVDALATTPIARSVVVTASLTAERDPRLARWSRLLPKSAQDMSFLERRLASGGYHSSTATVVFSAAPPVLAVMFALAVLGWFGFVDRTGWFVGACAAGVGYVVPGFYLDYQVAQRRRQIRNGLPDVLDLLIVCLEAGSSLDQSVVKAGEELAITYPALSDELHVLTTETRAGVARLDAFKNLAKRTKVEDVRTLVSMLTQTDRFGTSVAQTLRTMADDMRMKRRQAAEEIAAKVGVKLVFPLVFFMFPALFVVMLGPAIMSFMRAFPK